MDETDSKLNGDACSKVNGQSNDKVHAEARSKSEIDSKGELLYMQLLAGKCNDNEVTKGMENLMAVPLLQAIFTLLLYSIKTLQEQSVQIARLFDLSKPSLQIPSQQVAVSFSSQCSFDDVQDVVQGNHGHHKEDGDKHGQHRHGAVLVPADVLSNQLCKEEVDPVIHWVDYEREPCENSDRLV